MKALTTIIAVSLTLAAGTVLAQQPAKTTPPHPETRQAMDHSKMNMHDAQTDHNKMDMSGMSAGDLEKMAAAQFAKLDTNKDGSLSKAEFAKLHTIMAMQHGQMDGKHAPMNHGDKARSGMDSAGHQKMASDEFARLDINKDGRLSKTEVTADHPLAAHFDMLDTNKDGSVSKTEFAQRHGM